MNSYIDRRFYRDPDHKKISGICAGIAKYYGWERWAVRLVTILLFFSFPAVVGIAYALGSFLIPERSH